MTADDLTFQARARIDHVEFHNGKHFTVVTTPAPDEFSHPSRFKLQSQNPIGQQGQTVDFTGFLTGTVRPKQYIDKQTGMQKIYQEADVYINVVASQVVYLNPNPSIDKKGA